MIKKYSITVNGNTYDVEVEELGAQSSSLHRSQISNDINIKPQSQQISKRQATSVQGSGSVSAPMPGTINDVRVNIGDAIKKGQVLLILEAMKMENEIMASCDGSILAINVSKGTSVSVGDILVTIG
ncbi:biotin/lipoyl-containing protein [Romboutsia sp.]|uniref:biotin/lipoyl-containing protein n=1 Tax=Romboutsia sp. TaxID=1965302 RepID=UPI003F3363AB